MLETALLGRCHGEYRSQCGPAINLLCHAGSIDGRRGTPPVGQDERSTAGDQCLRGRDDHPLCGRDSPLRANGQLVHLHHLRAGVRHAALFRDSRWANRRAHGRVPGMAAGEIGRRYMRGFVGLVPTLPAGRGNLHGGGPDPGGLGGSSQVLRMASRGTKVGAGVRFSGEST